MKKIALWIFKMILRGIFGKMNDARVEKAERERDAAILKNESTEESMQFEKETLKKVHEHDKLFEEKVKARPADDPFGIADWNEAT